MAAAKSHTRKVRLLRLLPFSILIPQLFLVLETLPPPLQPTLSHYLSYGKVEPREDAFFFAYKRGTEYPWCQGGTEVTNM